MNTKLVQNLAYFGSNEDICRALGCSNDKIIKYSELANYTSLLQLLPKSFDYIIILIENDKNSGHWCCLIRQDNVIECFNSYGVTIDSEFRYIPDWVERWLNEDTRYLTRLIKSAPDDIAVISNRIKFQENSPKIATCSRWVVFRIEMARMGHSLEQFAATVKSIENRYDQPGDHLIIGWVPYKQDRYKK
jgi:hypothetical protein